MKIFYTQFFLSIFLLFSLTSTSLRAQKVSLELKMDSIFKKYNNKKVPGCAVAIVKNGKIVFQKGYGLANLEYNIPITKSSVFDIASLSKQFTGLAISILVQQKKIAVQDDIRKYLPDVPDFGKVITINNLLHHTSGFRDWPEALMTAGWRYEELASFDDVMQMVKNQKDLNFEPGSEYAYNNTAYTLLAAIVEKVTGKSFSEFTDSAIFKPISMNSSRFLSDSRTIIPGLAYSYYTENDHFIKSPDILTAYGSSSMYTTVDDLAKWVIHFQKALALKDPVYLRMLDKGVLNDGTIVPYGYGLEIKTDHNLNLISHEGMWAGYRTFIRNYPETNLSVVVLGNSGESDLYTNVSAISDIFFGKQHQVKEKGETATLKIDATLLKKATGIYSYGSGEMNITFENGQLMVQYSGEDKYPTEALSDTVVMLTAAGLPIDFIKDKDGNINSLTFRSSPGKRIVPAAANAISFPSAQYTGTYYSEELKTEYRIDIIKDKLFIHHFRRGDFPLTKNPYIQDKFTSDIGNFQFFRDEQSKVTGYKLSGQRNRNVRFQKI